MQKPRSDLRPNTFEYETTPLVKATGFREYDARWILEKEINLLGIQALGLGLATYVHEIGQRLELLLSLPPEKLHKSLLQDAARSLSSH